MDPILIRKRVKEENVKLKYVRIEEHMTNMFTKPSPITSF